MTTAAAVKLEMLTKESCDEKKEKLTQIMAPFFINLKKIQCIEEGSDDFYYAVFEMPLLKMSDDGNVNINYKGGISAQLSGNNQGIDIYLAMNFELLSALDRDLRSEFMGIVGIDPEDMRVEIAINNDDRESYDLFVEGAFLDGQEIIPRFGKTVGLKRRSEYIITLANVSVFALVGRGKSSFVYVGSVSPIKRKKEES